MNHRTRFQTGNSLLALHSYRKRNMPAVRSLSGNRGLPTVEAMLVINVILKDRQRLTRSMAARSS
jgi:hypothetical protein